MVRLGKRKDIPRTKGKKAGKDKASRFNRARMGKRVRVVLVVLALLFCALPVPFVNNVIGYIPLLALLFAMGISFAYLQILKRGFEYSEESLMPSCERGTDIEFVVNFKNKTPFVFVRLEPTFYISDLFGGMDTRFPTSMTLMPHEERDFRFAARFDHIGKQAAGVEQIVISDLLGLFTHTIKNPNRHQVKVVPHMVQLTDLEVSSESTNESNRAFQVNASDDMDYAGVRDYIWGDPLKSIHWKLSANTISGNYLTRVFEVLTMPGMSIIIDTDAPEYDRESLMYVFDGVVELGLAANEFAHENGLDSVIMFADEGEELVQKRIESFREFEELVDYLPRIKPAPENAALRILMEETRSIHGRDNIAFCTSHVDENVIDAMCELKQRKRFPMLFLVVPPSVSDEDRREYVRPLKTLAAAQIPYFVVDPSTYTSRGLE